MLYCVMLRLCLNYIPFQHSQTVLPLCLLLKLPDAQVTIQAHLRQLKSDLQFVDIS